MIPSPKKLKLNADDSRLKTRSEGRQGNRLVATLFAKAWLLMATITIVQLSIAATQASAQPIFRTPKQSSAAKKLVLQLSGPIDSNETGLNEIDSNETKMAPIRNVGSGQILPARFQLPQATPARGFLPPGPPSAQLTPSPGSPTLSNQVRKPELREVGADGSFLPVEHDFQGDQNQAEALIDLPGLDLSAMGLDLQNQQNLDERATGQGLEREELAPADSAAGLEQLPYALGRLDVPQERANQADKVRREQVVENYSDGKPRLLRTVALDREGNYYNDGPWVVKDRDGKVVAAGTYRKGVMQGQWARRHTSAEGGMFGEKPFTSFQGPFDSMANFKAGKLDGQWIVYDRAKRSIFEIGYEDGKRDGLATWFYPDTTKMRQATFKQGVLDGEVSEWDEDGRLVSKEFYADGRKLIRNRSFYRPEVPKEESYYLDVKLRQNGLDNWWDAKPAPYLSSGKRIQNGQARSWYSNRQLQYQGQFRNDKPIGRFFWWHENGNRSTVGQFNRAGDRDGRWIWWHDNGMKRIEGDYKEDQPSGVWRSWDEAGKLIKSKDYNSVSVRGDDDEVDPMEGVDPRDEEELLEGTIKTEPTEGVLSDDADDDGSRSKAADDGFLPLPQDNLDAVEPAIPSVTPKQNGPSSGPQFESLPPALGEASLEGDVTVEKSVMRNVGVGQKSSPIDGQPTNDSITGDFVIRPARQTGVGIEIGSGLNTNEVYETVEPDDLNEPRLVNPVRMLEDEVDDAVEPFDLSDLLE